MLPLSIRGENWEVHDLGTLQEYTKACIKDFNERGQVLVIGKKGNRTDEKQCSWAYWDSEYGLLPIGDTEWNGRVSLQHWWHRINGDGVVIGLEQKRRMQNRLGQYYMELLLWQPSVGTKKYSLPITRDTPMFAWIANCRSSSDVVVSCMKDLTYGNSYDAKVFSLVNSSILDLTPNLKREAELLGYDAGDWLIIAVNSQGMMIGRFDYYVEHPYKVAKVPAGTKYFVYDGKKMDLIDRPDELQGCEGRNGNDKYNVSIDSEGRVLFSVFVNSLRYKEAWLWSKKKGLTQLDSSQCLCMTPGRGWCSSVGLLDDGTIMWSVNDYDEFNGFAFQQNDQISLLPLEKDRQLPDNYQSIFRGLKIQRNIIHGTWPLIHKFGHTNGFGFPPTESYEGDFNSAGSGLVFFNAEVFGEEHPFILEMVAE